ncbi:Arv1 protein [Dimargaris cristalligena]|uniref:Protein ARV n=1 Tax=Dimargaris cristalligena TaxID=215637 RepID=A0A4Q0A2B8_9FUNG|nr:Arv1 protein [Dimargaris cristalligena]|eukprot:RKP40276.1 Arv1 protein [Dimargaris cristalligena]
MPTCIECGAAVASLYTEYSKGNIRLTQCTECHQFADRYVEHDAVLIFIDMMLHKPQVYRHLLFNKSSFQARGLSPSVVKLTILLILFDVNTKWFRLEKMDPDEQPAFFYNQPFYLQYCCILFLSVAEFWTFYLGVQLAYQWLFTDSAASRRPSSSFVPLVVSSFGKLLTILIVIWNYSDAHYSWMLNVLVFSSNIIALASKCLYCCCRGVLVRD